MLTVDNFMSVLHLRQPGSTDSACRTLAKHRKRTQNFKNELNNACFALDATYADSKDLSKRTFIQGFEKWSL